MLCVNGSEKVRMWKYNFLIGCLKKNKCFLFQHIIKCYAFYVVTLLSVEND